MTDTRVWNSGPPPHVGWWNASRVRNGHYWRWWDGVRWSAGVSERPTARNAALVVKQGRWSRPEGIQWTDYYPANARVPRLNPGDGWVLNTGVQPDLGERIEVALFSGHRCDFYTPERWIWGFTGRWLGGYVIYAWRRLPS